MIKIVQSPDKYNYSKSLPHIRFKSDKSTVEFTLYLGTGNNTSVILKEIYYPLSPTAELKIDLRYLLDSTLEVSFPNQAASISLHRESFQEFSIELKDDTTQTHNFWVLPGYFGIDQADASRYWKTQWLSGVFQNEILGLYDDRYLSCVTISSTAFYVDVEFESNPKLTLNLGVAPANSHLSVNVSPAYIQSLAGFEKVSSFEVYGISGNSESLKRHKISIDHTLDEYSRDKFLYLNSRGGWDTLVLTGANKAEHNPIIEIAVFDNVQKQIHLSADAKFMKTGFVHSTSHSKQIIEFLYSGSRHHLRNGLPASIILTNPQIAITKLQLNEVQIEFAYADSRMNYPELEYTPTYIKA